jgi:hypothetical protein
MTYVAMDTHKNAISVAIAESGRRGEVRFIGEIPSRPEAVAKMVDRLAAKHGNWRSATRPDPAAMGFIGRSPRLDITAGWSRPLSFRRGQEIA